MDPTTDVCTPYPPFGPDGTPLSFPPGWRTEAVLGLAFGIRTEEAFDRMPILADALEEAGCDDLLMLNHCRYCAHHTPECWVLDQLHAPDDLPEADTVRELPTAQVTPFQRIQRVSEATLRVIVWVTFAVVLGPPLLAAVLMGVEHFFPSFGGPKQTSPNTGGWQPEVPPPFQWKETPSSGVTGTTPASPSPSPPSPRR